MKMSRHIDPRYQSLLQKSVRRGYTRLVVTLGAFFKLLGAAEKRWFRQQTTIMAFRLCWPLAPNLTFTRHFNSKAAGMVSVARSVKNQDAAGLGAMAHAFSTGDPSVLDNSEADRIIRIISSGIKRPDDFWSWFDGHRQSGVSSTLWPRGRGASSFDRAVIQAAAYLAATTGLPDLQPEFGQESRQEPLSIDSADGGFDYWVVFDHHTREGQRALADISRDLHIPFSQLRWLLFYFEGARIGQRSGSAWWRRYCQWQFKKVGIGLEQAHLIWQVARPQLMAALTEDASRLHREIYRWKKSHQVQVNELKTEILQFFSALKAPGIRQKSLF